MRPPYSWVLNWGIKYFYVFRHRSALRQKSASFCKLVSEALSPRRGAVDTYKTVRKLSGAGGSAAFLDIQQPKLEQVCVPALLINSRDDPICVWENVRDAYKTVEANPYYALAELQRGGHGCKFGFWGFQQVAHTMMSEFVLAAWHQLRESDSQPESSCCRRL